MKNGPYELVVAPEDWPGKKYRGRYCYEHHLVYWQNTGFIPAIGEEIHHRNRSKRDNRFENLELLSKEIHSHQHTRPIRHGTLAGYRRKCRCLECQTAQREGMRKYRASQNSLVAQLVVALAC